LVNAHFDSADDVGATGEISDPALLGYGNDVLSACYGCSGSINYPSTIQWQMTTAAGSSGWGDVAEASATPVNFDGKWEIGSIPAWGVTYP
jgi:hypothetical protein